MRNLCVDEAEAALVGTILVSASGEVHAKGGQPGGGGC